jgi:hypothetical protein
MDVFLLNIYRSGFYSINDKRSDWTGSIRNPGICSKVTTKELMERAERAPACAALLASLLANQNLKPWKLETVVFISLNTWLEAGMCPSFFSQAATSSWQTVEET